MNGERGISGDMKVGMERIFGRHMGMNDIPIAIQKLVYIVCCGG